jgi:hypothetical protein
VSWSLSWASRLDSLDLVEHPKRQRSAVELHREPSVRIVHHVHLPAHQTTRQWRRLQDQHHPVVVQREVLRHGPFLAPGQDLVQIVRHGQLPMQILGVGRFPAEAGVVAGNEIRQPGIRRLDRGYPGQLILYLFCRFEF